MNKQKQGWLQEVEIMRAIGIVAVVLIHVSGAGTRLTKGSIEWLLFTVMNYSLQFAVPMFLLVSAFILAYKYSDSDESNWPKFYLGRVRQILLPYIIWTLIYLIYKFVICGVNTNAFLREGTKNTLNVIFFGKGYYHLYFMSLIMQFYLIFPLLLKGMRWIENIYFTFSGKSKNNTTLYNPVANTIKLFIMIMLLGLSQYGFLVLNKSFIYYGFSEDLFGFHILYSGFELTGAMIFSYIMPIGIGLWLGWNFQSWNRSWGVARWAIYPIAIATAWLFVSFSINPFSLNSDVFIGIPKSLFIAMLRNIFVTFFSLMIYDLANLIKAFARDVVRSFIIRLGSASFGIYLIHPLILDIWNRNTLILKASESIIIFTAVRLAGFALTLGLSWWIVEVCSKLPYVSGIFGNKGKKKLSKNTMSVSG